MATFTVVSRDPSIGFRALTANSPARSLPGCSHHRDTQIVALLITAILHRPRTCCHRSLASRRIVTWARFPHRKKKSRSRQTAHQKPPSETAGHVRSIQPSQAMQLPTTVYELFGRRRELTRCSRSRRAAMQAANAGSAASAAPASARCDGGTASEREESPESVESRLPVSAPLGLWGRGWLAPN